MRCDHCANDVPDGVFCTRCGAHQGTTGESGNAKTRPHRYAAHPAEHVMQPSVFTIVGGAVVGLVITLVERTIYNPYSGVGNPLHNAGISLGALLFLGLLVPI